MRVAICLLIALALAGCGSRPLEGTWSLEGPSGDDTVITFGGDGSYAYSVYNGEVTCHGTYTQSGDWLVLEQTSWHSENPKLQRLVQAAPLRDTEMRINWRSADEATLSTEGVTKVLRRKA